MFEFCCGNDWWGIGEGVVGVVIVVAEIGGIGRWRIGCTDGEL